MAVDVVKTFTNLKRFFARMLLIVTNSKGEGVPLAGTDGGALKVFLVGEDGSEGLTDSDRQLFLAEQTVTELKRIRVLLSVLTDEEVSSEQAERED